MCALTHCWLRRTGYVCDDAALQTPATKSTNRLSVKLTEKNETRYFLRLLLGINQKLCTLRICKMSATKQVGSVSETVEEHECPKCVRLLTYAVEIDRLLERFRRDAQLYREFKEFQVHVDTDNTHSESVRYESAEDFIGQLERLAAAQQETTRLYSAVEEAQRPSAIISVRLYRSRSDAQCRMSFLNTASHRCDVCCAEYRRPTACSRLFVQPFSSLRFGRTSNLQMRANSQALQTHMSKLGAMSDGDGTFYPVSSVVKERDEPGQSLLKQAIRVARGEPADGSREQQTQVPFQTFTTDRPALVPRGAAPRNASSKRLVVNGVDLAQHAYRPLQCRQDEFDIEARQNGSWYDQHFPDGKPTREVYNLAVAETRGTYKPEIVQTLNEVSLP